jgi:hypothetical protein
MIYLSHYLIGISLILLFCVIYNLKCEPGKEISPAQIVFASVLWPVFILGVLGLGTWMGLEILMDKIVRRK